MAEFMLGVESGGTAYQTTEHYLRRILAGDVASVRERLISALERLGYDILDDDETVVRGRREARGWGTSYSSADVLDYPMTLTVRLKQHGEFGTRATFDYVVKHPSITKGEREVLTREAEAISALASVRGRDSVCSSCGTESTDDSKFCRRCGVKLAVEVPELELLRVYAEMRAGYTSVVATFIASLASFGITGAALLALMFSGIAFGKGIGALLVIGMALSFLSLLFVGFGWNRSSRALKRGGSSVAPPADVPAPQLLTMPARSFEPPPSVTERTTNLLSVDDPAKTGEFANEVSKGLN
ncbi:MAG: zinc-ribbon domain-containing protein [Blastocatellia bacterium]|nr:zinc-ribbon domain-containing protein [Blastocatellia bacterium]